MVPSPEPSTKQVAVLVMVLVTAIETAIKNTAAVKVVQLLRERGAVHHLHRAVVAMVLTRKAAPPMVAARAIVVARETAVAIALPDLRYEVMQLVAIVVRNSVAHAAKFS